jgi:NDP-sugar pyrophosphorylase family protein
MSSPFSGMVLCAGLGNRLRPLTDAYPKPLIPLLDIPLAEQAFASLAAAGVEAIAVNTHHLPEQLAEAYATYEAASTFFLVIDQQHRMPAGALRVLGA